MKILTEFEKLLIQNADVTVLIDSTSENTLRINVPVIEGKKTVIAKNAISLQVFVFHTEAEYSEFDFSEYSILDSF